MLQSICVPAVTCIHVLEPARFVACRSNELRLCRGVVHIVDIPVIEVPLPARNAGEPHVEGPLPDKDEGEAAEPHPHHAKEHKEHK